MSTKKKDSSIQRTQFIMMFFAFAFGMILSNLLNQQSQTTSSKAKQEVLFLYKGIEKTENDIAETDKIKIIELNQSKVRLIENVALRHLFLEEAKKQNISQEEAADKLLNFLAATDEEVNQFYETNKDLIQKPFFEVRDVIKKQLDLIKAKDARRALINDLKQKGDLAILPVL